MDPAVVAVCVRALEPAAVPRMHGVLERLRVTREEEREAYNRGKEIAQSQIVTRLRALYAQYGVYQYEVAACLVAAMQLDEPL